MAVCRVEEIVNVIVAMLNVSAAIVRLSVSAVLMIRVSVIVCVVTAAKKRVANVSGRFAIAMIVAAATPAGNAIGKNAVV